MSTYTITPTGFQTEVDQNGEPISGALIYTYAAGTLTPIATYSNSTGTLNSNPIVADSAGRWVAYLTQGVSYKYLYCLPVSPIPNPVSPPSAYDTADFITGTTNVVSPVTVPDGGTGDTTLTNHGVLIGQGTSAVAVTTAGTSGQVLTSNGASADPSFQSLARSAILGFSAGATGTQAQNTTAYYLNGSYVSSEAQAEIVMPAAFTFNSLYVYIPTVGGSAQTVTVTLRKNEADTAITCSVASGSTTGSDTAHTVAYVAGDRLSLKCVTSATTFNIQLSAGVGQV